MAQTVTIVDLLRTMVARGVSDVHLQVGSPPMGRVHGTLTPFHTESLKPEQTKVIGRTLLTNEQWEEFEYRHELDFAYLVPNVARFRCNIFRQRGSIGLVMRVIPDAIASFESLGLPVEIMEQFATKERGIILTTGPTGSGKSTTMAAIIDKINRSFAHNIITIEDPIEYLHRNQRSLVVQREVGSDTSDFKSALKYAMRQDPDVIMIGEMRDKETVEAAITAAQTGHLVLSTLHTQDAIRSINRIIDFFAPHERDQIRILFAESLVGILSQRLLTRADGSGRVLALEVMINTPLIRELIKDENKTAEIKDALREGELAGMKTFDQHLVDLYFGGMISYEEGLAAATSPHEYSQMITAGSSKSNSFQDRNSPHYQVQSH
jgi:twitching motility protein PilT